MKKAAKATPTKDLQKIGILERYDLIVDMMKENFSRQAMAEALGISKTQVNNDVKEIFRLYWINNIEELNTFRASRVVRFENMIRILMNDALGTVDIEQRRSCFQTIIIIEKRLAATVGSDAPIKKFEKRIIEKTVVNFNEKPLPGTKKRKR